VAARRTYVLDTSVLLSDPAALGRFAEHDVVLPLVVVGELEGKRNHPELGWFARQALRVLDDHTVAYLDLIGSGAETIAHLRENASSPWPATSLRKARTSCWSARTCRCGSRLPLSD